MKRLLFYLSIALLITSCVPNKKLVYLQEKDELKHLDEIPKDSVLRTHQMDVQEYRIQPLDVLYINFESITDEEYDFFSKVNPNMDNIGGNSNINLRGVLVDVNGKIEYPVVGKVGVAGLTVFEAQDKMQTIVNKYLSDAVVRIRLLNFRFTVLGEINGEKVVNSQNTRVTMMEAIGLSGGFTELADRSNVKVIRQKGNTSEIFYIDLLKEDYIESEYFYVQQNDVIIVPPLRQRAFKRYFAQNLGVITSAVSAVLLVVTLLTR
ncbi:polysaccharide biosynthesis/export family protein [Fulvivirga sediminis]|uniref:Polysaccharide biosynthesis/export family protein n=1 Tax=Fulvivirga sediminis TaxID=2803949 RepID=A0A937K0C7_9BACT|nr:polysaccharide biosynthesis/export family protein [Fulvivirga sediminis]MBL3655392.1 polysaccharide biosynthesis/export family protein [Fulvivirga sediminis]